MNIKVWFQLLILIFDTALLSQYYQDIKNIFSKNVFFVENTKSQVGSHMVYKK